jgi:hypothetical protein
LLAMARKARDGELFKKLYDEGDASDFDGDRSAAVFKNCQQLAFWTAWDPDRMEDLLRASAWKDYHKLKRNDWVTLTIKKAIATTPQAYGQAAQADSPLGEAVEALRASADSDPWEGRGGPTDNHVFGALIGIAERFGTLKGESVFIRAAERPVALDAGVGRRAAARSLERLQKERKWIRRVRKAHGTRGTLWALDVPRAQGGHKQHTYYGPPLRGLRNRAPMPQKEFDKNGRKIHEPDYLLQRVGKLAALVLERVGASGGTGVTVEELADELGRRVRDLRRRTLKDLLEANLLVTGEDGRLRFAEDFEHLLEQELIESGCVEAEDRQRDRYEKDRKERFKKRLVDDAPTDEDLDREHRARVEDALVAWARPKTGPALTFRTYLAGETRFEYLVNATAFYYGADPGAWRRAVEEAYEIAVNGEDV